MKPPKFQLTKTGELGRPDLGGFGDVQDIRTMRERSHDNPRQFGALRAASIMEALTLLTLLLIAVPLKHLGGYHGATSVVGPIHGIAFLAYVWLAIQTSSSAGWSKSETLILIAFAFIPFGGFINERRLARKKLLPVTNL